MYHTMTDLAYLVWLLTIQVAFVTMLNVMSSRFLLFATYGENVKSQIPSTKATLSRFAWVNHTMQLGETVHAFNARVFGINKITSDRARLLRARRWGMLKFEAETRAEAGAGTSNGTIMDYMLKILH